MAALAPSMNRDPALDEADSSDETRPLFTRHDDVETESACSRDGHCTCAPSGSIRQQPCTSNQHKGRPCCARGACSQPADHTAQQSAWLALPHADAMFPAIFAAAISALCLTQLLPAWLLLTAFFPTFLGGVHIVVVTCGGIPAGSLMSASLLPLACVATLELCTYAASLAVLLPGLPQLRPAAIVLAVVGGCALLLHACAAYTSPGYVPRPVDDPEAALTSSNASSGMGHCSTCKAPRPMRSKHCGLCNRCVLESDHHCPVLHNCVGKQNMRQFTAYTISLLGGQLLFIWLTAVYIAGLLPNEAAGAAAAWRSVAASPGMALLGLLQVPCTLFNMGLAGRAALCAAGNLTTNELLRWQRFEYLAAADGTFSNGFDAGPAVNCWHFWRGNTDDWDSVLIKRSQGFLPPFVSVSTCLKLFHGAQQWLAAMRPQRQAKHVGSCCSARGTCSKRPMRTASGCCARSTEAPVKIAAGRGIRVKAPKKRAVKLAGFA